MSLFIPVPGTMVLDTCRWEIRLNSVLGRIPETVSEVICLDHGKRCGQTLFSCGQMKTKLLVAFVETGEGDLDGRRVTLARNMTFNSGCSCVARQSVAWGSDLASGPTE